jgi:hypothetical protein
MSNAGLARPPLTNWMDSMDEWKMVESESDQPNFVLILNPGGFVSRDP